MCGGGFIAVPYRWLDKQKPTTSPAVATIIIGESSDSPIFVIRRTRSARLLGDLRRG